MIESIITTYLLTVNGTQYLPTSQDLQCECTKHARSVNCTIGNILTGYGIRHMVMTTDDNGEPVTDRVTVECRQ